MRRKLKIIYIPQYSPKAAACKSQSRSAVQAQMAFPCNRATAGRLPVVPMDGSHDADYLLCFRALLKQARSPFN